MSKVSLKHKKAAPRFLSFAVITVSTSKYTLKSTGKTSVGDESGNLIERLLEKSGHRVISRELIPDDPEMIRASMQRLLQAGDVDAVITTGGTGVTKTDVTVETVRGLLEKELPGFGEILRRLSYERMGTASILTRAIAGVRDGKAIFCLPGSPDAVKVAVKEIIIPEAPHIVKHSRE